MKTYIKAADPVHEHIELCGLDLVVGFEYSETAVFFDRSVDIERLKQSLAQTIRQIPVLGGRLRRQDGRLLVDTDGPGVAWIERSVAGNMPRVERHLFPSVDPSFFNSVVELVAAPLSEWPLLSLKLTTFADGNHWLGISYNHAIMDGLSFYLLLTAWSENFLAHDGGRFELNRRYALTGGVEETVPAAAPGIRNGPPSAMGGRHFFNNELAVIDIGVVEYGQLLARLEPYRAEGLSVSDLLHAMILQIYARTSDQFENDACVVNLPFDLRRVSGAGVPLNYFGNALLFRSAESTFGQIRNMHLAALARYIKPWARIDRKWIGRDIACYQAQYEAGNYDVAGVFTQFPPMLGNGGLYINNMLYGKRATYDFGGGLIGGGRVLRQPFGVRMAMLLSNLYGGFSMAVALESTHLLAFTNQWMMAMARVIDEGLE